MVLINQTKVVQVEAKTIHVYAKVCDCGCYTVKDQDGKELAYRDGYVPKLFPGDHYGDYLILDIDIETGRIINWVVPTAEQLMAVQE